MLKIMKFTEGIVELKPGMVPKDADLIILPRSIKKIYPEAIVLNDPASKRIEYEGTLEEAERIMIDDDNDVICVYCADGKLLIKKI